MSSEEDTFDVLKHGALLQVSDIRKHPPNSLCHPTESHSPLNQVPRIACRSGVRQTTTRRPAPLPMARCCSCQWSAVDQDWNGRICEHLRRPIAKGPTPIQRGVHGMPSQLVAAYLRSDTDNGKMGLNVLHVNRRTQNLWRLPSMRTRLPPHSTDARQSGVTLRSVNYCSAVAILIPSVAGQQARTIDGPRSPCAWSHRDP